MRKNRNRFCRIFLFLAAVLLPGGLLTSPASGQMPPSPRPQKEPGYYSSPYWEGFILWREDKCGEAVEKLLPLARQGHGFENAQLAAGLCLLRLAGMPLAPAAPPERSDIVNKPDFKKGLGWILRAARAGHFTAQAALVSLYADNLGPDEDPVRGSMWAHLYLTNPLRLQIGAPIAQDRQLKKLQNKLTENEWLEGKELARNWIPVYIPQSQQRKTGE